MNTHQNWLCAALFSLCLGSAVAADDQKMELGSIVVNAPEKWVKKEPQVSIIAYEFAAPKVEGDAADGRLTVMAAGGSVEANIDRWYGQFSQPDGSATKDKAKTVKKEIKGCEVHLVDISGTYQDSARGPFGPKTEREKYRMLAAVVVSKAGQIFFKFYGPEKTVAANKDAFEAMINAMEVK